MTLRISYSDLPEEVTNYAFDQLPERLWEHRNESAVLTATESVRTDYENQLVEIDTTLVTKALTMAMYEKVRDIKREVHNGERDDYTYEDIKAMRAAIEEAGL